MSPLATYLLVSIGVAAITAEIICYPFLKPRVKCRRFLYHTWTPWQDDEDEIFFESRVCTKCLKQQKRFLG